MVCKYVNFGIDVSYLSCVSSLAPVENIEIKFNFNENSVNAQQIGVRGGRLKNERVLSFVHGEIAFYKTKIITLTDSADGFFFIIIISIWNMNLKINSEFNVAREKKCWFLEAFAFFPNKKQLLCSVQNSYVLMCHDTRYGRHAQITD